MSNFVVSWRTAPASRRYSKRVRALNGRHAINMIKERDWSAIMCVAVVVA